MHTEFVEETSSKEILERSRPKWENIIKMELQRNIMGFFRLN
jgi:hypothetical protein